MNSIDHRGSLRPQLWLAMLAILLAGVTVRIALLRANPCQPVTRVEAMNLAVSLVEKGAYRDPFGSSTGPSAHCMPVHPLVSAVLFRIFGQGLRGSIALRYAASVAASLGYALLPWLALSCGLSAGQGIAAGLFGALLPLNFRSQTSGEFDAPYTFLAVIILAAILAGDWQKEKFTATSGARAGLAAAITLLLNPCVLPILLFWFLYGWFQFSQNRLALLRYCGIAILVIAAALLPWALRNKSQLGRMIFTRSNFGLELQVSNNSLVGSDLEANVRNGGWIVFHPYTSLEEREKVRLLGEVAYNRAKLWQALTWIHRNPTRFLQLTIGRITLFWFPRLAGPWQTLAQRIITLFAIAGFVSLWKTHRANAIYLGGACVAYSLIYAVIQVSPRYRFPIEGFLLILASSPIWSLSRSPGLRSPN
jgi:hypothetical protein